MTIESVQNFKKQDF
uniref:Uncharacterized protein n=1 Tax=Anguilla anguilla TaxID=7936 RepID=A0A0E9RMN7_ANGAN